MVIPTKGAQHRVDVDQGLPSKKGGQPRDEFGRRFVAKIVTARKPGLVANTVLGILGVSILLVVWWYFGSRLRFIAPIGEVFGGLPDLLGKPETWSAITETWWRVVSAVLIAMVVGVVAAGVMWRARVAGMVVSSYVTVLMAVPSTVTALLCVFIFTNVQTGATVVLVLTTAPFIAVITYAAFMRIDQGLLDMASSYRFSTMQRWRHVMAPQLIGGVTTALRNEHAHAWKIIVKVEVFLVSSGMGFAFDRAFTHFNLTLVMQWIVIFASIVLASEYLVMRPLERKASKWKGTE